MPKVKTSTKAKKEDCPENKKKKKIPTYKRQLRRWTFAMPVKDKTPLEAAAVLHTRLSSIKVIKRFAYHICLTKGGYAYLKGRLNFTTGHRLKQVQTILGDSAQVRGETLEGSTTATTFYILKDEGARMPNTNLYRDTEVAPKPTTVNVWVPPEQVYTLVEYQLDPDYPWKFTGIHAVNVFTTVQEVEAYARTLDGENYYKYEICRAPFTTGAGTPTLQKQLRQPTCAAVHGPSLHGKGAQRSRPL